MITSRSSLLTLFILLQQSLIIIQAQTSKYSSIDTHYISSTIISTVIHNDEPYYENEYADGVGENDYDGEDGDDDENDFDSVYSPSSSISYTDYQNISSVNQEDIRTNMYDDEESNSSNQQETEEDDDDDDDDGNRIYADSLTNQRPDSHRPSVDFSSTSRLPFVRTIVWKEFFSKPTILVGIIGCTVLAMLLAILLVMFIIYRMRKKDEGSYVLEEAPRKSPSHTYTRVSSREFFA